MADVGEYTDDEDDDSSSPPHPPTIPPPQIGRIPCWCKDCMGMILQSTYLAHQHMEDVGCFEGDLPGASSSRQVRLFDHHVY